MAKSRSAKQPASKQPAPKQPAPKKQGGAETPRAAAQPYDPSKLRAALAKLKARYEPLTTVEREAFSMLATDKQCATEGQKTRGPGVFSEAVGWAVTMDHALTQYPGALRNYSARRFAWYLDRLSLLSDQLAAAEAKRGKKGEAEGSASSARDRAIEARKGLISRLKSFAGHRKDECAELDNARGRTVKDEELGDSIAALTDLGKKWLKRKDPLSAVLAEQARLNQAVIDDALAAAAGLTESATDATMAPKARLQDPPEVNVAEGWVLLEMKEALRLFAEANEKSQLVPKLIPGPATRHVLGRRATSGASEDDEGEPPAGEPPTGTTPAPG